MTASVEAAPQAVAPEVAASEPTTPEVANEIAAPQYGIGLQLFDPQPDATAATPDDDDNKGHKT